MTIPAEKRTHLIKLLGMMGSSYDGEVLNAARMAQKLLAEHKATWSEVFSSAGDRYQEGYNDGFRVGLAKGTARPRVRPITFVALSKNLLEEYEDDLTPWELGFVQSFVERGWSSPSPKQRGIFERICERLDLALPD